MATSQQVEIEIGERLARLRLSRNVTQAVLAGQAGIGVRTLRRLEGGEPSTLDTFLRVIAALDLEEAILSALPEGQIRPIERISGKGNERQRARPVEKKPAKPTWTWGEESDD
ncbi:transcriptional regulator [Parasedimentitalea maritima]|uniref:Transcriptional regulator n=1 Tax=Parasedimentitalea maritima TaxID=2578117 RepID=A0ABY2UNT8_9RHOB|nr:helix-turn-helix domain-containing protein [Zongyanglinia marina]TLP55935.1 transcriptional regulator [Zongyanglinia marina]